MNEFIIAGVASALLSLILSFVPGAKNWYGSKSPRVKQLIFGGLLALGVVILFGMSCGGFMGAFNWEGVSCDESGFTRLIQLAFVAYTSGVTTYRSTNKLINKDEKLP